MRCPLGAPSAVPPLPRPLLARVAGSWRSTRLSRRRSTSAPPIAGSLASPSRTQGSASQTSSLPLLPWLPKPLGMQAPPGFESQRAATLECAGDRNARPSEQPFDEFELGLTDRLLSTGLVLAIVGAVTQGLLHAVNALTLASDNLDANSEKNVFSWASSVATFGVAFGALLAGVAGASRHRLLFALAACAVFLSLDDAIGLHERISLELLERLSLSDSYDSVVWPALYSPLLVLLVLLLRIVAAETQPRVRRFYVWGVALLALAIVLELVSAPWSTGENAAHLVLGGIEESAELAGWILLSTATAVLAAREIGAAQLREPERRLEAASPPAENR